MMSASMLEVGRYVVLMAFHSQTSRRKWKRTLICLVRSWNIGFFFCKLDCTLVVDEDLLGLGSLRVVV